MSHQFLAPIPFERENPNGKMSPTRFVALCVLVRCHMCVLSDLTFANCNVRPCSVQAPPPAPDGPDVEQQPAYEGANEAPTDLDERSQRAHGVQVHIGNGYIVYYASHNDFYAVCSHGSRCRMTRTRLASGTRPNQGRPLGLLAAWLLKPQADKASHTLRWNKVFAYDERVAARQQFALAACADLLLGLERPARADEPDGEPLGMP